ILLSLQLREPATAVAFQGLVREAGGAGGPLLAGPAGPGAGGGAGGGGGGVGHRLVRLRWYGQLARERPLLYGIVHAVPDPVMLTDSEGRIVVARSEGHTSELR